jgi:hypothetical protein
LEWAKLWGRWASSDRWKSLPRAHYAGTLSGKVVPAEDGKKRRVPAKLRPHRRNEFASGRSKSSRRARREDPHPDELEPQQKAPQKKPAVSLQIRCLRDSPNVTPETAEPHYLLGSISPTLPAEVKENTAITGGNVVFQRDTAHWKTLVFQAGTILDKTHYFSYCPHLPHVGDTHYLDQGVIILNSRLIPLWWADSRVPILPRNGYSVSEAAATIVEVEGLAFMSTIQSSLEHYTLWHQVIAESDLEQRAKVIAEVRGLIEEERRTPQSSANYSYLRVAEIVLDFLEDTLDSRHFEAIQRR